MPLPGRLGGPGLATCKGAWAVACAYARNYSCCWWHTGENRFEFYPCHCAHLEESIPRAGDADSRGGTGFRSSLLYEGFWGVQADLIFPHKIYLNSKFLRVVF